MVEVEKLFRVILISGLVLLLVSLFLFFVDVKWFVSGVLVSLVIVGFAAFELKSRAYVVKKSGKTGTVGVVNASRRSVSVKPAEKKASSGRKWWWFGAKKEVKSQEEGVEWESVKKPKRVEKPLEVKPAQEGMNALGSMKRSWSWLAFLKRAKQPLPAKGKPENQEKKGVRGKNAGDKRDLLKEYAQQSLRQGVPKQKIAEAAEKSNWPEAIFLEVLRECENEVRKKKLVVLAGLCVLLVGITFAGGMLDLLLFEYWVSSLSFGSGIFYSGVVVVLSLLILLVVWRIAIVLKHKRVEYHVVEHHAPEEAKSENEVTRLREAQVVGAYETDLDKLYRLVMERKKMSISDVAKEFQISKKEAESWGKILKDEGLIVLYYPTMGEPELQWKKEEKKLGERSV